jgi:predicted transposase YdaD
LESLARRELEEHFEEKVVLWHERFREEGLEEGRAEGRAAGRAEGRAAGRAETKDTLRRQATRKFGADTAANFGRLLAAVNDPRRLAEAGEWIIDCDTGDELIERVASSGNGS